jgi:hypothetical protein
VLSLVLVSCGSTKTEQEEEEEAPPKEEVEVPPEEEEEIPAYEKTFKIGETVESDKLEVNVAEKLAVTVTEISLTDSYEYYRVMDERWDTRVAPEGSTFIIAQIKIKNISSTDTYKVGTWRMRGGDITGDAPPSYYFGEDPLEYDIPLPPGEEIDGKLQSVVQKGSTGYYVRFRFSEEPEVRAKWVLE